MKNPIKELLCKLGLHAMHPVKTFMRYDDGLSNVDGYTCRACGKRRLVWRHLDRRGFTGEKQRAFDWLNHKISAEGDNKILPFKPKGLSYGNPNDAA